MSKLQGRSTITWGQGLVQLGQHPERRCLTTMEGKRHMLTPHQGAKRSCVFYINLQTLKIANGVILSLGKKQKRLTQRKLVKFRSDENPPLTIHSRQIRCAQGEFEIILHSYN